MRALIWFTVGWSMAGCLWVVLDIYGNPPESAPLRVRNVEAEAVAPPPRECEAPADASAPTARRARPRPPSAPDAEHVMASPRPRVDANDEEPWSSKYLPLGTTPAPSTSAGAVTEEAAWPELAVTLGAGNERFLLSGDGKPDGQGQVLDLRLLLAPRGVLGAELGYLGTLRDGELTSTVEVVGRWHPYPQRKARPFIFGGAAWRHVHESGGDALALPLGAGLSLSNGRWYSDARFTIRPTPAKRRHTVGLSARVGATF
jgi:hypothetical protein